VTVGERAAVFRPAPVVAPAEQIRTQLVEAINKGELRPGDRLPSEGHLARQFGVSGAQVRAGLDTLVNLGLIEITRGRGGGLRVARPDPHRVQQNWRNTLAVLADLSDLSIAELAEARREVEIICARAAADRRTDEDLRRMAETLDEAADPGMSRRDWLDLDITFHRAVADAGHNRVLAMPLVAVHAVSQPRLNELIADQLDRAEVTRQHRAIYEAIASGSAEAAGDAVQRHVAYLEALYVRVAEAARDALRGG
jgi:GntR family transcriptional regulator, transcriptional repressor for pyruvate dehydrogenase complex